LEKNAKTIYFYQYPQRFYGRSIYAKEPSVLTHQLNGKFGPIQQPPLISLVILPQLKMATEM